MWAIRKLERIGLVEHLSQVFNVLACQKGIPKGYYGFRGKVHIKGRSGSLQKVFKL
jgi:hypothetical protein